MNNRSNLLCIFVVLFALGWGPASGSIAATPAPAKASDPVRIVIEQIKMDRPLIAVGLDQQRVPIVPRHDVGWYKLSARPGQGENIVLWGHVLRFKSAPNIPAPFARLREVPVGAPITIITADGKRHRYVVTRQVWATPDQVEYILPQGRERLTMVSCIGSKVIVNNSVEMTHRLITIAEPQQ
jgi:sortase (surface protein transpeptidase)